MLSQIRASRFRDRIELAIGFLHGDGLADLVEICQGRIDHARARGVEASRALLERADQLIAMSRLLLQQSQQHQLQFISAELAAAGKALAAHEACAEASEPVTKAAPAAAPADRLEEVVGVERVSISKHILRYI